MRPVSPLPPRASVVLSARPRTALSPSEIAAAGALFPAAWEAEWPGASARGFTKSAPVVSVLAHCGDMLVGHIGVTRLTSTGPLVCGLGDLAMHADLAPDGCLPLLVEAGIDAAEREQAAWLLVSARDPALRRRFLHQGFRPTAPNQFEVMDNGAAAWDRFWLCRTGPGLIPIRLRHPA
jgi:hypothetical protein